MTETTSQRLYKVPAYFWEDHSERCPCDDPADMATEIREAGGRMLIEATPRQLATLRSDAAFYAEGNVDGCPALVRSARATLAAIAAAPEPATPTKRPGRPPGPTGKAMAGTYPVRLTTAQREKLERLGGAQWVRDLIDATPER